MEPDKYQQAWQAHSSQTRVTIDRDLLQQAVLRNQRDFLATILRRDVIEVGVGVLLLPYWFYQGITQSLPWTWYLSVPALLWVIGFFLVDRRRHPQTPSGPGEPLLVCVKNSLAQVEHQIWLLRNVFWWYLLPPTISIFAFFADVAWSSAANWLEAIGFATPLIAFLVVLYYAIDALNQRAIRTDLAPRRRELLTLSASLAPEDTLEPLAPDSGTAGVERPGTLRRWLVVAAICFATFFLIGLLRGGADSGRGVSTYEGPPAASGPAGDTLAQLLAEQRREKLLVGLAAMVMVDGKLEAAAAVGERKLGSNVPLKIGDAWHLGGVTKSITATMIARLIEAGEMQWTDTVGEVFPDAPIHEQWKRVTLRQLLTDTAGAPANFPIDVRRQQPARGPERTLARRDAVLDVLAHPPVSVPGERFAYSNVGYCIAAAMAEQATSITWERLVEQHVFAPLNIDAAGFGPPISSDATLEQPRGHLAVDGEKIAVRDTADNTPIMGPSGSVHMTLENLAAYLTEHLRGRRGAGELLSTEMYDLLHEPELNAYACGWLREEPSAALPHTVYWHNGSNTFWYALVAFIPDQNMVIAITANDGDSKRAEEAAWEILQASAKRVADAGDSKP